jgi:hypothetical protein
VVVCVCVGGERGGGHDFGCLVDDFIPLTHAHTYCLSILLQHLSCCFRYLATSHARNAETCREEPEVRAAWRWLASNESRPGRGVRSALDTDTAPGFQQQQFANQGAGGGGARGFVEHTLPISCELVDCGTPLCLHRARARCHNTLY